MINLTVTGGNNTGVAEFTLNRSLNCTIIRESLSATVVTTCTVIAWQWYSGNKHGSDDYTFSFNDQGPSVTYYAACGESGWTGTMNQQ